MTEQEKAEKQSLPESKRNFLTKEERDNLLDNYWGERVVVVRQSLHHEFSKGPAEWARNYAATKGGVSCRPEDIDNAEGIFCSFRSSIQSPGILRDIKGDKIKIMIEQAGTRNEWIPFISESREEFSVNLSGDHWYSLEVITKIITSRDEVIFEKTIDDYWDFRPDDVKEKMKRYVHITIPPPED